MNRLTVYYLFFIVMLFSCCNAMSNENQQAKQESNQDLKSNSFYDDSILLSRVRLSEFERYQSFDEFNMTAIGAPNKSPFVYIKELKDLILLVVSNDTAQVYIYQYDEQINRWVSYKEYDMEKKDIGVLKEENVNPARSFLRICGNDTILEYECDYIFDHVFKYLFVKTRQKCIRISLLSSDFEDKKDLTQSILLFVRRYFADKSIIEEGSGKYAYQKRCVNEYILNEDSNCYKYNCIEFDEEISFPKSSLGYLGIQPGFDKRE